MYWLFLVICSSFLLSMAMSEDICMWGISVTNGLRYNGPYLSVPGDPQINGESYWKLDRTDEGCTYSYYFIYYNSGRWRIGIDFTTNLAFCDTMGYDHPSLCPSWTIGSETDTASYPVQTGDCPSIDCGTISVTSTKGSSINCKGAAEQIASNVYNCTDNEGYLWFFNEASFSWKCVSVSEYEIGGYSPNYCSVTTNSNGYTQSPTEWQDLDASTTTTYDFTALSGSTEYDIQFSCTSDGATFTKAPTSPNPTTAGVVTPYPTFAGVDDPTQAPSDDTPSPTVNPTDGGGGGVTDGPTSDEGPMDTPSPTDASTQSNINIITIISIAALCLSVLIV
eukprot:45471_1